MSWRDLNMTKIQMIIMWWYSFLCIPINCHVIFSNAYCILLSERLRRYLSDGPINNESINLYCVQFLMIWDFWRRNDICQRTCGNIMKVLCETVKYVLSCMLCLLLALGKVSYYTAKCCTNASTKKCVM